MTSTFMYTDTQGTLRGEAYPWCIHIHSRGFLFAGFNYSGNAKASMRGTGLNADFHVFFMSIGEEYFELI